MKIKLEQIAELKKYQNTEHQHEEVANMNQNREGGNKR
jgi:hypothetical protein